MAASLESSVLDATCDFCLTIPGTLFCEHCNQVACKDCEGIHRNYKHNVSMLFDTNGELTVGDCLLHNDILSTFCRSCDMEICAKCRPDHIHHKFLVNKKLILKLQMVHNSVKDILNAMRKFKEELKVCNVSFIKQTQFIEKQMNDHAVQCMKNIINEKTHIKAEINNIVVSNKDKFDEIKRNILRFEKMDDACKCALLSYLNNYLDTKPETIVELYESLNSMLKDNSITTKENFAAQVKSLGFSFPRLNYKPQHEVNKYLGKLEKDGEDEINISSVFSSFGESEMSRRPTVISGVENRLQYKIFTLWGEVDNLPSNVIINFINNNVLSGIDCNPLLNKAGKKVKYELLNKLSGELKVGDLITTEGGNINCEHIVHCLLPTGSTNDMMVECSIREGVARSLKHSESLETNTKRFVISICLDESSYGMAGIIVESIFGHLKHKRNYDALSVNLIGSDEIIMEVVASCVDLQMEDSMKSEKSLISTFPSGFQLELCLGSLIETMADAMLVAVQPSLDLKNGQLSSQILEAAGQGIQDECFAMRPQDFRPGDLVVTTGHRLKYKYVYHGYIGSIYGSVDLETVSGIIMNAIRKSLHLGLTSLAMPALGTGIGLDGRTSAALIMEQVYQFGMFHSYGSTLKKVVIVLRPLNGSVHEAFSDYMKAFDPLLRIPEWTSIINLNMSNHVKRVSLASEAREGGDILSNERQDKLESDMKQLSLKSVNNVLVNPSNVDQTPKPEASQTIWRYKEKNGKWMDYPRKINKILEESFLAGREHTRWSENGKVYRVVYSAMTEEVCGTNDIVEIRRDVN